MDKAAFLPVDEVVQLAITLGWKIIPCKPDKTPLFKQDWKQVSTSDEAKIRSWKTNIYAVHVGPSNLLVVDVDSYRDTKQEPQFTKKVLHVLDSFMPPCSQTMSGGRHYYFYDKGNRRSAKIGERMKTTDSWLETRAGHGYAVLYPWKLSPFKQTIQHPPLFVQDPRRRSLDHDISLCKALDVLIAAKEGTRNDELNKQVFLLARAGVPGQAIEARLKEQAQIIGLSKTEIGATVNSAKKAGKEAAPKLLGERADQLFMDAYTGLEFVRDITARNHECMKGRWKEWQEGSGWSDPLDIYERLVGLIRNTGATAPEIIVKAANPALKLVCSATCQSTEADWNVGNWIGLRGGSVLDTETGEVKEAKREMRTTLLLSASKPTKPSELWINSVLAWADGDEEMAAYLQRLVGYSLLAGNPEHIWTFFWGTGSNGKSTFLETISSLFADYHRRIPARLLLRGSEDIHLAELAVLDKIRLVISGEIPKAARWNEERIKDLTGGDRISVRRMAENPWDMHPMCLLIALGNSKPEFSGADMGWARRMILIPFKKYFPKSSLDINLSKKLAADMNGVLGWAVDGLKQYLQRGLQTPASAQEATDSYLVSQGSPIASFIDQELVPDKEGSISLRELLAKFKFWAETEDELTERALKAITVSRFRDTLESAGVQIERTYNTSRNEVYMVRGFSFKPQGLQIVETKSSENEYSFT